MSHTAHRFVVTGARAQEGLIVIHPSSARGGRERKMMSIVAASTFAPFSARVRSAIPARSRRASPSSTRRPVATARAEAEAGAGGEGSTSSTTSRTAGRRAGLAAGAGLALAAAAFPARAIGGAAVGLPDVVELTPDNFAKQVRRSARTIRTPLSIEPSRRRSIDPR